MTAEEQSLPPSTNLQNSVKFLSKNFVMKYILVYPHKLPENLEVEDSNGEEEIHKLISWYGVQKSDTYKGKTTFQKEDLEADKLRAEWPGFTKQPSTYV